MSKVDDGLRPLFRKHLPGIDWQSVETGGTGSGVPDSNYCAPVRGGPSAEGWIEYKATRKWSVDLRPEQIGWIARRVRHGGRVWIAVRRRNNGGPKMGPPVDELWMFPGRLAVVAKIGGLRHPEVQKISRLWHGGPTAGWNWDAVVALLRTR